LDFEEIWSGSGYIKSCEADLIVYEISGFHSVESLVYPEDGSSRFLQTIGNHLHDYMVSQPRKSECKT
jgi:hypothetical protein